MKGKLFQCQGCGYQYDEDTGDEHEGYPPGTIFESLPADFVCPDCAVCNKSDFLPVDEIEGTG